MQQRGHLLYSQFLIQGKVYTLTELHLLPNKMLSSLSLGQAGHIDLAFSGEEEAAQGCISAQMKICCICRYFSLRAFHKKALFEKRPDLRVVFGMQLLLQGAGG